VIGTVSASDPEGNPITYGISDPRFTINGANQIVVANGATFPEATVNLVISASDGIAAPVTINKSYQVGNPPPAFAAHYNVGGGAFTAADGTVFTAPPALSGGTQTLRNATTQAVTETTDDALYQTYAFGTFGYDVAVPGAGDYTVTLYLAETFFTAAGARLFDVALEGTVPAAFNDIDVFARTGARWEALELSTTVTVTDGVLDLDVISLINNGLITGFSVVQAGNVVSSNDTATVAEDTATLINVLANDGAGMAITTLNQPLHGTVSVQAGQVLYTPAANYFGTDSFTYTSDDGAGGAAPVNATVSINVTNTNDNPSGIALSGTHNVAETALAGAVIGQLSGFDPDGDTLIFTDNSSLFDVNAAGQLVVAGGANLAVSQNTVVPVTITASDGNGGSVQSVIGVTITDNPPPTL
jgi:hypothetical protein